MNEMKIRFLLRTILAVCSCSSLFLNALFANANIVQEKPQSVVGSRKLYITDAADVGNHHNLLQSIERVSVKIIGPIEGSGVIVRADLGVYRVLTAWHVIKDLADKELVEFLTFDGQSHKSILGSKRKIGASDLGIIEFKSSESYRIAKVKDYSSEFKRGMPIYIAGYPSFRNQINIDDGQLIYSTIENIDSGDPNLYMGQGYHLIYTNETVPGMSGGGLFLRDSSLVGIHGRGEIDRQASIRDKRLSKSGVNYGMPLNIYLDPDKATAARLDKVKVVNPDALTLDIVLSNAGSMLEGEEHLTIALADEILILKKTFPAFYLKAKALFALDDLQGVINMMDQALKLPLTSREKELALSFRKGANIILNKQQDVILDSKRLLSVAKDDDDKASALIDLSDAYQKIGQNKLAAKYFKSAQSLLDEGLLSDSMSFLIYQSAASREFGENNYSEALIYADKALTLEALPSLKKRLTAWRATYLFPRVGKLKEGISTIKKYIADDELNTTFRHYLAILLIQAEAFDEAEKEIIYILDIKPRDPDALYILSLIYKYRDNNIRESCLYLSKSIQERGGSSYYKDTPLEINCRKHNLD